MDSQPVRDDREEYLLIHRHYNKLLAKFPSSRFIFIPENNLGLESAHLDSMVGDLKSERVETFWEKNTRPGVHKDAEATRGYQFLLNLCLARQQLHFATGLFTVTPDATPDSMRDMLQEQMLRLHWESKTTGTSERHRLTAKIGSKQDDLLISIMMLLYWGRLIMNSRGARL